MPTPHDLRRHILPFSITVMAIAVGSLPARGGDFEDAAERGDLPKLKSMLKDDPDLISGKNKDGETALHLAADGGRVRVVKWLLENKADPDAVDNGQMTALHHAVRNKLPQAKEMVEVLLAGGAKIDCKEDEGATALDFAVSLGSRDVAQTLLAHGADVNTLDKKGLTPLHWAAYKGHRDVAALLLADGGDVTATNGNGETPLHLAASGGHADCVELLLVFESRADAQNKTGQTALHWAALGGHSDVIKVLLSKGAAVDIADATGNTALHMAAAGDFKEAADLLLAAKATCTICDAAALGDVARLNAMLKNKPELASTKDRLGLTPLHWAAMNGHRDAAAVLLADKADINAKNNDHQTPLEIAQGRHHDDMAKYLRDQGALD